MARRTTRRCAGVSWRDSTTGATCISSPTPTSSGRSAPIGSTCCSISRGTRAGAAFRPRRTPGRRAASFHGFPGHARLRCDRWSRGGRDRHPAWRRGTLSRAHLAGCRAAILQRRHASSARPGAACSAWIARRCARHRQPESIVQVHARCFRRVDGGAAQRAAERTVAASRADPRVAVNLRRRSGSPRGCGGTTRSSRRGRRRMRTSRGCACIDLALDTLPVRLAHDRHATRCGRACRC